ncbi:MAG: TetR/AcrR family transcriptional regulator [Pseudoramibacter sp.]
MIQNDSRKTHTVEYLSQAFWTLYQDRPIRQITVKALTEKAGVHRSSFYGHFEDIYDLLSYEESKLLAGIEDYLGGPSESGSGQPSLDQIIQYYQQNLPKLSLLCGENGDPSFSVKLRARIIPEVMAFVQIPQNDKTVYYILDFLINGMLSFLTTWYRREGEMPAVDTLFSIRDALMNGFKTALIRRSSNPHKMARFMNLDGSDVNPTNL